MFVVTTVIEIALYNYNGNSTMFVVNTVIEIVAWIGIW